MASLGTDKIKGKKPSKHKVLKGSADHRIERRRYLSQLVHEFSCTNSKEAKLQVLANLANFGYDPYNYNFFKELNIVQLFLYQLKFGKDKKLVEFAMGGLCNCCDDDTLRQEIIDGGGFPLIKDCFATSSLSTSTNINVITSALTIFISLINSPHMRHEILSSESIISTLHHLIEDADSRIRNLANILLTDYFPSSPSSAKRLKLSE